jgi:mRNA interferase MazF
LGVRQDTTKKGTTVTTVPVSALGRQLGFLLTAQETALTEAIRAAFDLD